MITLGLVARAVFTGPPVTIRSIAVLPLENLTGDVGQDYFTDGMTDALTTTLAQIESLPRDLSDVSDAVSRFEKSGAGDREGTGVDAVVAGSVARSGDRVRINAQLIEHPAIGTSGSRVTSAIEDVLALQGENGPHDCVGDRAPIDHRSRRGGCRIRDP